MAAGLIGILGRASARLSSRNKLFPHNQVGRWSSLARQPRGLLAADGSSNEGGRQEHLWRQFFWDPTLWWDNRQHKRSLRAPDFRHRQSQEVLWLNNFHKPAWVDAHLAALDMGMERAASNRRLLDDPNHEGVGFTAETVSKLCHEGHLTEAVEGLEALVQTEGCISGSLCYAVLKKCVVKKDLVMGSRVHALTVKLGYQSDTFLGFHTLRMYAAHGRLQDAVDVFDAVAEPDAFTWSAIISAYVKHGQDKQAMQLYHRMRRTSVNPDGHVFVAALQACARGSDLKSGQQVHADVLATGMEPNLFVCSCLVDMYAKCGSLVDAQRVFDGLAQKDVVTWNALIAGYSQQGMGQEALQLYCAMLEEGVAVPNSVTFACLLQACGSVGNPALEKGRQLHAQIRERGHETDVFVTSSLVNMYAKCGSLTDAQRVFDGLCQKNVVTWNAMIAGYSQQGMGEEALGLYSAMLEGGMAVPDSVTFVSLLQACARVGTLALQKGKQLHLQIRGAGLEADVFVASSLMNMYAKCGSLEDAESVFEGLDQKDLVMWNAMIAGYSQRGMGQEALRLYNTMQEEGITVPDSVTFICLLQACASMGTQALQTGKQLHSEIKERGHQADVFVANGLVNMYAKCGSLEDAQRFFDELGKKDLVTWNAIIGGYSQQGMLSKALRLYNSMQEGGLAEPDSVTFVCLLQACASVGIAALENGKELHTQIRERGHLADVFVGNSLVNMYAKCGSVEDAQRVFDGLGEKNVVTWNAMIAGYSQQGMLQEALGIYSAMLEGGMAVPDSVTFMCLLQACAIMGTLALQKGKQLHAQIRGAGLETDVFVANSLVNMYAKCGSLEDAHRVFDRLSKKDLVTWNAMIGGYSQQGMGHEALYLYSAMQEEGTAVPDSVTFVFLLQSCATIGTSALEKGKLLHAEIKSLGHQSDVFVSNSLVNMYTKCGSLEYAQSLFNGIDQRDLVTWNAMIAGYSQNGMGQEALRLYSAMQEDGQAVADSVTFVYLLQACARIGTLALQKGKQIHAQIKERGHQTDVFVANSLVDMYAKCGSLEDAQKVFDGLGEKDLVTWNAMIAGYSQQGMGKEALSLYHAMQAQGMAMPDSITYVCLLQACANMAALHSGRQVHAQVVAQGLQVDVFVAGSLIDMYGKSGSMVDAQQVFDALPETDVVVWNALIAGYASQGNSDMVFNLVQRMQVDGIQPDGITLSSVLTVCSHAGLVKKGWEYFEAMSIHYCIPPTDNHYTCMVDLLGRAGQLDEALGLISTMPLPPSAAVWHTLLGACQKWSNVEVGRHAFNEAVKLDKKDAAAYVLMSNIYTGAQMWDWAQKIQARRTSIRAWKPAGLSWWTDKEGLVHSFLVGDMKNLPSEQSWR